MFPKLFWDQNGIERVAHDGVQEAEAVENGWSDHPPLSDQPHLPPLPVLPPPVIPPQGPPPPLVPHQD
jgi:hypothetical protein